MPQSLVAIKKPVTFQEVKEIAATVGPAVTVYLPSELPGGRNRKLPARILKVADDIETRCLERGFDAQQCREFAQPLRQRAEGIDAEIEGPGLMLLRSPEAFRSYWLPREVQPCLSFAANFHIRPILDLLPGEKRFYLLALAQKDLRLLHCTERSFDEIDLGPEIPGNMMDFLLTDVPDHLRRNKATSGPAIGAGPSGRTNSVAFGSGADENKEEYIHQYFAALNKVVNERTNHDEKIPLVLAGVDFEVALYRTLNTYPHLCRQNIQGSANAMRALELHSRALHCLEQDHRDQIADILSQHENQAGGLADAKVTDVVKWAFEGRVAHLLVAEGAQVTGNFDEVVWQVQANPRPGVGNEDLVNAAAIQTILHGGDVVELKPEQIPGRRPMAAVVRY